MAILSSFIPCIYKLFSFLAAQLLLKSSYQAKLCCFSETIKQKVGKAISLEESLLENEFHSLGVSYLE